MKKFAISFSLFILLLPSAQSQVRFGVKGGITTSGVSGSIDTKNVSGFTLGPTVEAMINERFGAQASILFAQKGIQVKGQSMKTTSYIEIPTSFKIAIPVSENIKPYMNGGPYVGFRIAGDKSFSYLANDVSQKWKSEWFTAGLNFGAGVELLNFLQLGVNYGFGLTDNYKFSDGSYSVKDRTWSITAAVYFYQKK
jgi:Outer membrane protein beta-barrel domain